jgi:hypothetical protein
MQNDRVLTHIANEIDKLRVDQVTFIANGGAKEFAEYRHVCGIIRGLTHAESIVKDLVQRMETDDD